MADKKGKSLNISIDPAQIVGSEIMKSGDYKYARMGVKVGDDQYMSISYEWKGESIPEFVMGLFEFMKANVDEIKENKEEFISLKERIK
jgi:hypothetical protein